MHDERYPGERRGLRLFLEGLLDAVDGQLGRDAILYHRIRTALQRGDLTSLRTARQMFNHQDTALKRRLSLARQERGSGGAPSLPTSNADIRSAAILTLPSPNRRDGAD